MTSPLQVLSHHTQEAARLETVAGLAKRCGVTKSFINNAMHPGKEHGEDGKRYPKALHDYTAKLMDALGLTFAPANHRSTHHVSHVSYLILQWPVETSAKAVAIAAVRKAWEQRV